jgi:hypothetical protein
LRCQIIKVVHRLKAQLNEFFEPQAQALGSGVFEPRLSRLRLRLNGFEPRLRLNGFEPRLRLRLRLSLSSLKSL